MNQNLTPQPVDDNTADPAVSLLRESLTLPNLLTSIRLVLVVPFATLIWQGEYDAAFGLALLAAVTDVLDGWLARKFKWTSRLGAFLDPAADKLTALVAFYLLSLRGELPSWLFMIALARDASLLGGFFILFLKKLQALPKPLFTGRVATFMQFILIFSILFPSSIFSGFQLLRPPLVWLCALSLSLSFIDYARSALQARQA